MNLFRVSILAIGALFVAACNGDDGVAADAECLATSTFGQIQEQIFEGYGCTDSNCHGDATAGGLDLRADVAYSNLVGVQGVSGEFARVFPAEQDLSLLYLKLAAKLTGENLGAQGIGGAKVLAKMIENGSTETEMTETVQKIESLKAESLEHIRISDESRPD